MMLFSQCIFSGGKQCWFVPLLEMFLLLKVGSAGFSTVVNKCLKGKSLEIMSYLITLVVPSDDYCLNHISTVLFTKWWFSDSVFLHLLVVFPQWGRDLLYPLLCTYLYQGGLLDSVLIGRLTWLIIHWHSGYSRCDVYFPCPRPGIEVLIPFSRE